MTGPDFPVFSRQVGKNDWSYQANFEKNHSLDHILEQQKPTFSGGQIVNILPSI